MGTNRIFHLLAVAVTSCLLIATSGCAVDYPSPDTVVLQQARSGMSLIYFLRGPHDSGPLLIEANGKRLAKLHPETYTALSLPPGNYRFLTKSGDLFTTGEEAEPLEVTLEESGRKFFYVSGNEKTRPALTGITSVQGSGPIPLLGRQSIVGNKVWKECSELGARGLITISRRVEQE